MSNSHGLDGIFVVIDKFGGPVIEQILKYLNEMLDEYIMKSILVVFTRSDFKLD